MMKNLPRLQTLADMVMSEEMAKLGQLNAAYQAMLAKIDENRQPTPDTDPAFFQTGASDAWERWRQSEIARLNMDLARLRVDRERQEQKTRTAVARVQVLRKIAAKATGPTSED